MPEQEITNQDILHAVCGRDSNRQPKSAVSMVLVLADTNDTEKVTDLKGRNAFKPEIVIAPHRDYIQVDLRFLSHVDNDLRFFWEILNQYGEMIETVKEDAEEIPALEITVTPVELDGEYYFLFTNPISWALTSEKTGTYPNIIRMVFEENETILARAEGIDLSEIQAEAKREAKRREAMMMQDEMKRMKEKARENGGK